MIMERMRASGGLAAALTEEHLRLLLPFARERAFAAGEYLFRQDANPVVFFVIEHGKASIELAAADRPPIVLQTLGRGDLVGLSWWFASPSWRWDARAVTDLTTFEFDAGAVRDACAGDVALREAVLEFVAAELAKRLHRARVQLLDVYGRPGE